MTVISHHQIPKPVVGKEKVATGARKSFWHPKEHAQGVPVEPYWYDCDVKTDIQTPWRQPCARQALWCFGACGLNPSTIWRCSSCRTVFEKQIYMGEPKLSLPSLPGTRLVSQPLTVSTHKSTRVFVWSENVENTWGLLPPSGYNWCSGWLLSYQTKEKGQRSTQLWVTQRVCSVCSTVCNTYKVQRFTHLSSWHLLQPLVT